MFDAKACRSCLTVKGKLEKIGTASKRQYTAVSGLQISDNDGYPNYFCAECRVHIRKSIAFRRKSRRAHFVLKEIMSIRKQVTYSDIVTVNRKRTNLESSLNFWEPHSSACFLIANEEGKEEDLKKYNLQSQSHSKHLVDIEPDVETPVPDEPVEPPLEPDPDTADTYEDIPTNDYLETDPDPDIDMNDIFKDFKEVQSEEEEAVDNDEKEQKPNKRMNPKKYMVDSLILFNMKVLTLEEQKNRMEVRRKSAPFVTALYKCSMCITVHKSMQELVEHVTYHNERKFPHDCQVCKNKFPLVEELNIHVANCHMYEYECRLCRVNYYCQEDAVSHARRKHLPRNRISDSVEWDQLVSVLKSFKIVPLTPEMMSQFVKRAGLEPKKDNLFRVPGKDLKCDICGIWLKTKTDMERHMITKHRYMYTCKKCQEVFTTRATAFFHNYETHKRRECADLNPKILTEKALLSKINDSVAVDVEYQKPLQKLKKFVKRKPQKEPNLKLPCNVCGVSAQNEQRLFRHQLREHKYISINDPLVGDPEHKCEGCRVQFMDRNALETHLVNTNHAGADNVPFACVPCKKRFEDEEQLETHYITCIAARKYPRKCCYCFQMLHDAVEYKSHYLYSHPTLQYRYTSRNSICDICGKSIFKPFLEAHLKTHSGGGYPCHHCDMTHATPAQHVTHVLANHTRCPYRCAACHRRFKCRADCKEHILKVHAPTKLYKCEFCAAEFSFFGHLKKHSEKLHNLVIPQLRSNFQYKTKDRIIVYAHMKIELNEMERPVVEKTKIELIDYLEQKTKPVDYNDYFIFNNDVDDLVISKRKKYAGKRKVKRNELEEAVSHIKVQYDFDVDTEPSFIIEQAQSEVNESELESKVTSVLDSEMFAVEKKDVNVDIEMKDEKMKDEKMKDEKMKDEEMKVEEANPPPLEVVESDGHQYVMIDGEMYRIANEDDLD